MSKPTKQKLDEWKADIARANGIIQEAWQASLVSYSKPVVHSVKDSQRLAKVLSEKFKNLKVSIAFEDGYQSVFVTPTFKPFEAPDHEHYVETRAQEALNAATSVNLGSRWPAFAEVSAYARGFDQASSDKFELEASVRRLKEENSELKRETGYMHMMPWMMRRGFYGG